MAGRLWVPVPCEPLARYASGYGSWLTTRGYSRWTVAHRLWQLDLLSRWLEREEMSAAELTPERVEAFLAARRASGYLSWVSVRGMVLPLEYLREQGAVPAAGPIVVDGPLERLLVGYRRYLLDERGLAERTVLRGYVPDARVFLEAVLGSGGLGVGQLGACDGACFWLASARGGVSPGRGIWWSRSGRCCVGCTWRV